jgi:CubicO group peptidase (beta-lactamase class C family)
MTPTHYLPLEHRRYAGRGAHHIQNGKFLLKKAYGLANLQTKAPITADTAFRLASLTKQFTAMVVMMLAERGD